MEKVYKITESQLRYIVGRAINEGMERYKEKLNEEYTTVDDVDTDDYIDVEDPEVDSILNSKEVKRQSKQASNDLDNSELSNDEKNGFDCVHVTIMDGDGLIDNWTMCDLYKVSDNNCYIIDGREKYTNLKPTDPSDAEELQNAFNDKEYDVFELTDTKGRCITIASNIDSEVYDIDNYEDTDEDTDETDDEDYPNENGYYDPYENDKRIN